jgi:hypothetical protein
MISEQRIIIDQTVIVSVNTERFGNNGNLIHNELT